MGSQAGKKDWLHRDSGVHRWFGAALIVLLLLGATGVSLMTPRGTFAKKGIEPGAGLWRTWVLTSGKQLRPAAPPGTADTQAELKMLRGLAQQRDQAALDRIAFWNTSAPVYRWNEVLVAEALEANSGSLVAGRGLALLHAAIYDATIAAWDAKYTYDRPRPSEVDRKLTTVIENPASPSYPAEHAVTAGAASEILAYLYPARADYFRSKAEEAAEAFLVAGVQYPSDVSVGLQLGRDVAALVIQRAQNDNSNTPWDGVIPVGDGYWTGQNPVAPTLGKAKTWVLKSGSDLRPGPPYAPDSPEMAADIAELNAFVRTPRTNAQAQFWEWGAGGPRNFAFWNDQLSRKLLEYNMGDNPPRTARAFALMNLAYFDSIVACWDAKYTYWAARPFQMIPNYQTLFTTPNHPSYPSAHGCLSGADAEVLAYLFPRDAASFQFLANRAGEARMWAGLHFRHDVEVGVALGRSVGQKMIERAQADGSQ